MKRLKVLLLWDAHYEPHVNANLALLETLALDNEKVVVIICPSYYKEKHGILSNVICDQELGNSRLSFRKQLGRPFRQILGWVRNRPGPTLLSQLNCYPQVQFISSYSLVKKHIVESTREQASSLSLTRLLEVERYGIKLAPHWSVDLSLDCKTLLNDICVGSPQDILLRSLAFHSFLILEALSSFCASSKDESLQFISTSVYSLDWLCREYVLAQGSRHVFVQVLQASSRPSCKVYKSVPEDLFLRRGLQAQFFGGYELLNGAVTYASNYIANRISLSSHHTYSPLDSDLGVMAERLAGPLGIQEKPLWVYYTNSPDELVSIAHAYQSSEMREYIPWIDSGFLRNESEAIMAIVALAHKRGASLVVRQHPRLWCEKRSQFVSSTYGSLSRLLREQQLKFPGVLTIIEPWEHVNSYELAILSDKVISFRGTMPLEVSLLGIKPIVLARNKGIMNYWIQLHAESAPKSMEELELLLSSDFSDGFSMDEMCCFLIQFYLLNQYGTVELARDHCSAKFLSIALERGSSVSHEPAAPSSAVELRAVEQVNQLIEAYFLRVYNNLIDCFF